MSGLNPHRYKYQTFDKDAVLVKFMAIRKTPQKKQCK